MDGWAYAAVIREVNVSRPIKLSVVETRATGPRAPEAQVGATAPAPPSEWWLDQALAQTLYSVVKGHDLSSDTLEAEIATLEGIHGNVVYAELIFLLTRLKLDPTEARRHWEHALSHRSTLGTGVGRDVDLRVGLISYYLDVNRCLERPKIVEMEWMERATASAYVDELTALPNYRFFREHLGREVERSRRDTSPLSLVLLDIDDFKAVNDQHGHEAGNFALASIARTLRANVRGGDLVARYGGEEFVVLLPSTPKAEAKRLADRLRFAVSSNPVSSGAHGASFALTMSLGVATCPADAKDDDTLVVAADRALYEAKSSGKNQVRLYGGSTRSYARRKAAWSGHVRRLEPVARSVETVEIGESGLMFLADEDYAKDALVEAIVNAPNGARVTLTGRVAWSRATPGGRFEVAVRAIDHGTRDAGILARWVSTSEGKEPATLAG